MSASARWSGDGFRFDLSDGHDHAGIADESPPLGKGEGMSPPDLLLAALCGSTGITAVSLLRGQGGCQFLYEQRIVSGR